MTASLNVSVPRDSKAPRPLNQDERSSIARVADILIPAAGRGLAASDEPGFWSALATALNARSDAFQSIANALRRLAHADEADLWDELKSMDQEEPRTFQALSTVIAGAWLLTPGVRDRIGYLGPVSHKAGLNEAADEISSGVLDPVIQRHPEEGPRWIR